MAECGRNRILTGIRDQPVGKALRSFCIDRRAFFRADRDHAILDKRTGKIIYEGGEDIVLNKRSKAVTKIIDNGKDYVINIWLKKPKGSLDSIADMEGSWIGA